MNPLKQIVPFVFTSVTHGSDSPPFEVRSSKNEVVTVHHSTPTQLSSDMYFGRLESCSLAGVLISRKSGSWGPVLNLLPGASPADDSTDIADPGPDDTFMPIAVLGREGSEGAPPPDPTLWLYSASSPPLLPPASSPLTAL